MRIIVPMVTGTFTSSTSTFAASRRGIWSGRSSCTNSSTVNTVWDALEAFLEEHRGCGALDGGVDDERVWMACDCGADVVQSISDGKAAK